MARMARLVVPGYPHHVTQRGNRRQRTFFNPDDYQTYIELLSTSCKKTTTTIWAYCLMPNHVHLVMVPTKEDGLRSTLGEAHRRYTRHINFREGWRGHLWQERFHSFVMDEPYLVATVRYVERNPVVAHLCERAVDWPWSSTRAHVSGVNDALVTVAPMLEHIPAKQWEAFMDRDDDNNCDLIQQSSRTGRPLGSETFIRTLEVTTGRKLIKRKPGPKPRTSSANDYD